MVYKSEEFKKDKVKKISNPNLFGSLKPYIFLLLVLVFLTVLANGLNLIVPRIIAQTIDTFNKGNFALPPVVVQLFGVAFLIFLFTYLQSLMQTYISELAARDLRTQISEKVSRQSYSYIESMTPSKILTNFTSDVDAVKSFISQAIPSIISSIFLIVGASILLFIMNWRLTIVVLLTVPIIGITFYFTFRKVRKLFLKSQEAIDWLNKVISESILGSALIRLLNSEKPESEKFLAANAEARNIGLSIMRMFARLVPVITFATNMAILIILILGGNFVITGSMTLGEFTAFYSYLSILIFPIIILSFMSNVIAQANASYFRISEILTAKEEKDEGIIRENLHGDIRAENLLLIFGEKTVLKNISFLAKAGTKTAIIGPTAAGKTQLLYLITGLLKPTSGAVEYDGKNIDLYNKESLHSQVGFVFQDSIIFNMTLRENIAFSNTVKDEYIDKAIDAAELRDFINELPEKLDTVVSERGASLSGGQKQRIMLARALAINPKILLLDDFTARVDAITEKTILDNIQRSYPALTLISVTQKISSVEKYDQIIVLMEGEVLATGTHKELMEMSTDYVQIYNSQRSTSHYELQA